MQYETPVLSEKQMWTSHHRCVARWPGTRTCPPNQFKQITVKRLVAKAIFETGELDNWDELLEEPTVKDAMSYEAAHITNRYPALIRVYQVRR